MDKASVVRTLIRDRAKLLGFIWVMVRDHHAADDLFQDVTVLALEHCDEINDEHHLSVWCRKAARLKALEAVRRRQRKPAPLDDDLLQMIEDDWGAVDSITSRPEVDYLRGCVERLSPRARRVLHLRYVEGLSGARLASHADVGIEVKSLYVALSRIHRALHECITRKRLAAERRR
jgi:RNA polymerase sigma-70 factor (ECF subfamily)